MRLFTSFAGVGSILFLDLLITVHSFHLMTKYPYLKQYSHEVNSYEKFSIDLSYKSFVTRTDIAIRIPFRITIRINIAMAGFANIRV